MNKFMKKCDEMEALGYLYDFAENQLRSYMHMEFDEEGNAVRDENGENVYTVPTQKEDGEYTCRRYYGWKAVIELLDSLKI